MSTLRIPSSQAGAFLRLARPFVFPAEKPMPQKMAAAADGGVSRRGEEAAPLIDMHLHLDWYRDPGAFGRGLETYGSGCLGCTVEPQGYEALKQLVDESLLVHPALGLHPWYLGEGASLPQQLDSFCQLAQETLFIGEVGMDFGKAQLKGETPQRAAFAQVCEAVQPGSLLSIHSVRAAGAVLDILESSGRLADSACIFHWFSGTSDELARAREAGCLFSVGPFMLKSRRGREYARQIPSSQLLLETDLPEDPQTVGNPAAHVALLKETRHAIEKLKGQRK